MRLARSSIASLFFFTDPATTEIYTLSLHDALPISERVSGLADHGRAERPALYNQRRGRCEQRREQPYRPTAFRSEEHTSELQSHSDLVCRLLLEKKKENQQKLCGDDANARATVLLS